LFQRAGAVFPQRSERSAPVFTPLQTQPLSSYPQNIRDTVARQDTAESSADSEFPALRCISITFLVILYVEVDLIVDNFILLDTHLWASYSRASAIFRFFFDGIYYVVQYHYYIYYQFIFFFCSSVSRFEAIHYSFLFIIGVAM